MKIYFVLLLSMLIVACGGSSSNDDDVTVPPVTGEQQAKFSLGVSDAPVDDAIAVVIEIDTIKILALDDAGEVSEETLVEEFVLEDGTSVQSIAVNLLEYQGADQKKIIDELAGITLDQGNYKLELVIVDAGSYVELDNDANLYAIKVPSSRLRLGEFAVDAALEQQGDTPAYTIEFDLRSSLVQRGNDPSKNGFILKPHGIKVVSNTGGISGTISAENLNLGPCTVYLYSGGATELGDLFDAEDESFTGEAPTASAPLASVNASVAGEFEFGFVEAGDYVAALRCNDLVDDNIQFDGLTIPSPGGQSTSVTVTSGNVSDVNF
ncbi:DUF4382 domain-containing protein [Pseudoalteromonas spongiae]|uniref:DUF4382 domain-containing protein n=1 Tax=Pseudoalteromonas spongiae TaxID=298657 RepID=A0ABU8EY40_9GAMM